MRNHSVGAPVRARKSIVELVSEGAQAIARTTVRRRAREVAGTLVDGSVTAVASLTRVEHAVLACLLAQAHVGGETRWVDASTRAVAETVGVSRTAAAEAMRRLREDGYVQYAFIRRGGAFPWSEEGARGSRRRRWMYRPTFRPTGQAGRWCEEGWGAWAPSGHVADRQTAYANAVIKWDKNPDGGAPWKDEISPSPIPPPSGDAPEAPREGLLVTGSRGALAGAPAAAPRTRRERRELAFGRGSSGSSSVGDASARGQRGEESKSHALVSVWASAVGARPAEWMERAYGERLADVDPEAWAQACAHAARMNPPRRRSLSWVVAHWAEIASHAAAEPARGEAIARQVGGGVRGEASGPPRAAQGPARASDGSPGLVGDALIIEVERAWREAFGEPPPPPTIG